MHPEGSYRLHIKLYFPQAADNRQKLEWSTKQSQLSIKYKEPRNARPLSIWKKWNVLSHLGHWGQWKDLAEPGWGPGLPVDGTGPLFSPCLTYCLFVYPLNTKKKKSTSACFPPRGMFCIFKGTATPGWHIWHTPPLIS